MNERLIVALILGSYVKYIDTDGVDWAPEESSFYFTYPRLDGDQLALSNYRLCPNIEAFVEPSVFGAFLPTTYSEIIITPL